MRKVNKLLIHCSASDLPHQDSVDAIKDYHTAPNTQMFQWGIYKTVGRGFKDIGYHFVITKDGTLFRGRSELEPGAHCSGHNKDSIGICVTGDMHFTQLQFDTLKKLIEILLDNYSLPNNAVYAHNYFTEHKNCPNFDLKFVWPCAKERGDE